MKLYWTGTDSLMLIDYSKRKFKKKIYWFIFRLIVRKLEYFIQSHYATNYKIKENLLEFGFKKPIEIQVTPIRKLYYGKLDHKKFTILYYIPSNKMEAKFRSWLYGFDIYFYIKEKIKHLDIEVLIVDGSEDMVNIYPIVDFYLRPNRHDGSSRMVRECAINNIPYYWSTENPDPEAAIEKIKNAYEDYQLQKRAGDK